MKDRTFAGRHISARGSQKTSRLQEELPARQLRRMVTAARPPPPFLFPTAAHFAYSPPPLEAMFVGRRSVLVGELYGDVRARVA
jgi:hypothetical protein